MKVKQTNNNLVRWVLISPLTLLISFFVLFLLIRLSSIIMVIPDNKSSVNLWFIIGGGLTALSWVYTSFTIAPTYKAKTAWISYLTGSVLATIMVYPSFKNFTHFQISNPWVLAHISAVVCGLLLVTILGRKNYKND